VLAQRTRRVWLSISILLFILLVFAALRGRYVAGGRSVAAWKHQMQSKGEKFLIQDLAPPSVQTNALASMLARANQGLPAAPAAGAGLSLMRLVEPGVAETSWATNVGQRIRAHPWEQWLGLADQFSDELSQMRQAVNSTPPSLGWDYRNYATYPSGVLIDVRKTAYWLASVTLIELHRSNELAALTNLLALLDLAQCYEQEMTVVSQMIRVALVRMAVMATWEALQSDRWCDTDLKRLQAAWNRIQLARPLERAVQMERAIALSYFEKAKKGDTNGTSLLSNGLDFYSPIWKIALSQQDELRYLTTTQGFLEAMRAGASARSAAVFLSRVHSLTNQPRSVIGKYVQSYRYPMSHVTLLNYSRALHRWMQTETERQLVIAAIGLKRYYLQHRAYPEQLVLLTPEILPELPVDYMDGKPLRYRPAGGYFVLYSVGDDGIDQGGNPGATNTPSSIWDGPDVLWPRSAD